ncbi:MAG: hypothetical protein LBL13_09655 [Bacteroidales bacterium]|jgi:hypothetical protein|nr:hypothetical protein [Bacteroidales bacterium]
MKNIFSSIVFIQCLLFASCQRCKEDEAFKNEFSNCLQVVEKIQLKAYFLPSEGDFECRVFSIECLYAITGYEGYADKITQPYYYYPSSDTIEYIDVDINKWQEWYEDNKCTFTMQMADSLIKKHAAFWDIPSLTWPISADSLVNYDKYTDEQW